MRSLFPIRHSGTNLLSVLLATIYTARYCGVHKNGFIQLSDGVRTKLFTMHITRSESYLRKCPQRDGIYAYFNQSHGYVERCQFGVKSKARVITIIVH